ncbi:MAG: ATP-binding cassette domain-containing protein [Myxococcota bacterium]|nr:ATP-binding cassette domain-containing protein [Myxococcota bacterium]
MAHIRVEKLSKNYGTHEAVKSISFTINSGEIVGFLGPNGAGKSTTMKMLTGYLSPNTGLAHIKGIDVQVDPIRAQQEIGYLPENAPIYPEMTVGAYLNYCAKIRKLGRSERAHAIDQILDQVGIRDRYHQRIGELSKGYRQRVGLAQALLHKPPIVILDEPTSGLDPNQIRDIRELIQNIGQNRTVLLSTHILSEVQATCDRVIIINNGQLVADGGVDDVILQAQGGLVLIASFLKGKLMRTSEELQHLLNGIDGVTRSEIISGPDTEHRYRIHVSKDIRTEIFGFAVENHLSLVELQQSRSDLEDVFRQLTER